MGRAGDAPVALGPADGGAQVEADAGVHDAGIPAGLVQIDGGFWDGYWMIEWAEQCSNSHGGCWRQLSSTFLRLEPMPPGSMEVHGDVGDAGPGWSTVSFDGGQFLVEWPTIEGRTFAAPAVGERIFIDVDTCCDVEEPARVEVYSAAGRLLIASDWNPIFTLLDDPSSPRCSNPAYQPECCCDGYRSGVVTVDADSDLAMRACEEATVYATHRSCGYHLTGGRPKPRRQPGGARRGGARRSGGASCGQHCLPNPAPRARARASGLAPKLHPAQGPPRADAQASPTTTGAARGR